MISTGRQRATLLLGLSGLAHLGVFLLLAMKHMQIRAPAPPPTFEVTIVPRFAPRERARAGPHAPAHPLRPRRAAAPTLGADIAPLVDNAAPSLFEQASGVPVGVRQALRRGPIGCANGANLDQAETDACLEAFGKNARSTAFIAPPMARDKRSGFDEKVAAQEEMRIYRQTGIYPGMREALKAAR